MERFLVLTIFGISLTFTQAFGVSYTCGADGTQDCGTSVQLKNDSIQKIQDAMALNSGTTMWMLDPTGTICYEITNQRSVSNPIFVPNVSSALAAAKSDFANIVNSDKTGCSSSSALCIKIFPPAKCSVAAPTAGKCGAASGANFASAADLSASANLCGVGSASPTSFSGAGPWSWSCVGTASTDSSCTASITAINGACGAASGGVFASAAALSAANLCSAGVASPNSFSGTGPWSWSCAGSNGGTTDSSCTATSQVSPPPECGDPQLDYNMKSRYWGPLCKNGVGSKFRSTCYMSANSDWHGNAQWDCTSGGVTIKCEKCP